MKLILVRHGQAEERSGEWADQEEARPLTQEGRRKFRQAARGMNALELKPSQLFYSPLLRARQTADLLVAALGLEALPTQETALLLPGAPPELPFDPYALGFDAQVVLVGHNPHLTRLASRLLADHDELGIDLKKGGLLVLTIRPPFHPGTALLEMHLTQGLLRRLR